MFQWKSNKPTRARRNQKQTATLVYETLEQRNYLSAAFPAFVNGQFSLGAPSQLAPYGNSNTFRLESMPGATRTIYLDFNGHYSSGNQWNHSIQFPPYNNGDNSNGFTSDELAQMQKIFQNVAEDFLPFQVNVTTLAPDPGDLVRDGDDDHHYGIRVVVTQPTSGFGSGLGGIAKRNSFTDNVDTPVFVFSKGVNNAAIIATHEVGHSLGLTHDGYYNIEYYGGHGSGRTGWGPLMGTPYYRSLSQWSNGSYTGATNGEDDISIIGNAVGFRSDDIGNSFADSRSLMQSNGNLFSTGIIHQRSDVDMFHFEVVGSGQTMIQIKAFQQNANLDILARLYRASGTIIASSNPSDQLDAQFDVELTPGTYFLSVDGIGKPGSYTDYGSLGFYTIEGNVEQPPVSNVGYSGVINGLTEVWRTIPFNRSYVDPVVVVGPLSNRGPEPASVRVRNVTDQSFDVHVDEWDYLNASHSPESVGYMVIEAGTHTLIDGTKIIAGNAFMNHEGRRIGFGEHFAEQPVVLSQVTTFNGVQTVTTRASNVDMGGFDIELHEQEAADNLHQTELFSWIAIEQGVANNRGRPIDVRLTDDIVDHTLQPFAFTADLGQQPVFLAAIQSLNGSDPAVLRYNALATTGVSVFLDEEQSADLEVEHAAEQIGFVALDSGNLFAIDDSPNNSLPAIDDDPIVDAVFSNLENSLLSIQLNDDFSWSRDPRDQKSAFKWR